MLLTKCIHPTLLGALGKLGHGSWILLSDGGYPHITASNPSAEKVYLNLTQGLLTVTQVLEVLKETVPIEAAAVMTPPAGAMLCDITDPPTGGRRFWRTVPHGWG